MAKYRLLKDLPNLKKGTILSEGEPIFGVRTLITKNNGVGPVFIGYDLSEELFEEIQEPTDSIHWKPVIGEEYWSFHSDGGTSHNVCTGCYWDAARYKMGRTYRTKEECIRARDRELAEARLRRTSTFKPDFLNDNGGWVVFYNPREKKLETQEVYRLNYGELVRYETKEEAEKSIKENEKDWLAYFGIEERQ